MSDAEEFWKSVERRNRKEKGRDGLLIALSILAVLGIIAIGIVLFIPKF